MDYGLGTRENSLNPYSLAPNPYPLAHNSKPARNKSGGYSSVGIFNPISKILEIFKNLVYKIGDTFNNFNSSVEIFSDGVQNQIEIAEKLRTARESFSDEVKASQSYKTLMEGETFSNKINPNWTFERGDHWGADSNNLPEIFNKINLPEIFNGGNVLESIFQKVNENFNTGGIFDTIFQKVGDVFNLPGIFNGGDIFNGEFPPLMNEVGGESFSSQNINNAPNFSVTINISGNADESVVDKIKESFESQYEKFVGEWRRRSFDW